MVWIGVISCKNEIDLDVPTVRQEIVVDGWIENGDYPYVILTASSQYYSVVDSATLRSLVLSAAKVTVSNGTEAEVLTLFMNNDYFPPYIYRGTRLKGQVGKTYDLTVEYGGRTVTAQTTIPKPVTMDSLWFSLNAGSDTLGVIKGILQDNASEKNYYKTFSKIIGENKRFIPTLISDFNDKYFNGETFRFSLNKGNETYLSPNSDYYFNIRDTVLIRISTLDKASHQFWTSYEEEIANAPNPFASSHREVLSNIRNGLGIWCGYGSTYYVIIASTKKRSRPLCELKVR